MFYCSFKLAVFDEKCQHSTKDIGQTAIHFTTKQFLGDCCCNMWYMLGSNQISCIDPNVLIPILRRIAMRDVVDPQWFMCGEWDEILTHLNRKLAL